MSGGIIRRKLGASGKPAAVAATALAPAGAGQGWRLALARALRDGTGLLADVTLQGDHLHGLAEVLETLPERAFLAVLDGPGGKVGLLALSLDVLAVMVERQTMGRVSPVPPSPRRPTRVDAAMVMPVFDRALISVEGDGSQDPVPDPLATGFRTASFLDDPKPLGLLLEEETYRVLTLAVSAEGGARSGEVRLALPLSAAPARAAPVRDAPPPGTSFAEQLEQAVLGSEATVTGVLGRISLTLSRVMALEPGAELSLGPARIDRILIEGRTGEPVAYARLGQHRGQRALRLSELAASAGRATAATVTLADPDPGLPMMVDMGFRAAG